MKKPFLFIILSLVIVTGCNLKPRVPDGKQLFLLDVVRSEEKSAVIIDASLKIRSCKVTEPFNGRSLVYRTGSVRHEQDHYNLFLTCPDEQMTEILRMWFQDSRLFSSVETQTLSAKYTLEPQVNKLYIDFRNTKKPMARVQMHARLTKYDESCSCSKIIFDKTLSAQTPLSAQPAAAEVVEGLSQSFAQILHQLESEMSAIPH